jgi:hypothetical protein
VQANVSDLADSKHGIKVLLSLLCDGQRHLPPHAIAMMHVAERSVAVAAAAEDAEGTEADGKAVAPIASGSGTTTLEQVQLGVSKKDPTVRR